MNHKTASNVRKIALVAMIAFDVVMLILLAIAQQWVCFWMFVTINIVVGIAEVVNSLWVYGKTVSTQITKTLEQQEKMRPVIYGALLCFLFSMFSLFIHWWVWAKP